MSEKVIPTVILNNQADLCEAEMSEEVQKILTPRAIEELKNKYSDDYQTKISALMKAQDSVFPLIKWTIYLAVMVMSFAENQAFRTVTRIMNLGNLNFFLSLVVGLIIGHISHVLAAKEYTKHQSRLHIIYPENLKFLEEIPIIQLNAKYTIVFNLVFYLLFFLVTPLFKII